MSTREYQSFTYRGDIDGLRAFAVLAVVIFHLGIEKFEGGFIGVDIFFVISGFLITGIITPKIKASELKPLLHTWSLGVEEQFYLIWPAFIIALHKLPVKIKIGGAIASVMILGTVRIPNFTRCSHTGRIDRTNGHHFPI